MLAKISMFEWKLSCNRLMTGSVMYRRGVITSSVCIGYVKRLIADKNHMILFYSIAKNTWSWLLDVLSFDLTVFIEIFELVKWVAKQIFTTQLDNSDYLVFFMAYGWYGIAKIG